MKKNLRLLGAVTSFIIYLSVFLASFSYPIDPDLGWHLKYGQYFWQYHRVLRDNTFSALMPYFKWNNSSWATDLLTYQTFHHFGFVGITILGALVITATFFFIGRAAKLNLFEKSVIFPILTYVVSPVNQISFRGQLLSLLFIGVMYYILSKYGQTNKKIILLLIPFFTLWSNFHGEFILGLALFFIWVVVYIAKEIYLTYRTNLKKFINNEKFLLLSFFGSIFSVLINPFGLGVYIETLGHFENPLQQSVIEFQPLNSFSTVWWHQLIAGLILVIGLAMLGIGKKTLDKAPYYIPSFILFIFTFWIRRYAWPFYYSLVFLLKPAVNFLKPESQKYTVLVSGIFAVSFLAISIWTKYPFDKFSQMNWSMFCKLSVGCSPTAAQAVIDNGLNNSKLLTIYDYGGWLIWNYPQIKPTIDGRMHLWRDKNGYSGFEYYYPIEQNTTGDIDSAPYNIVLTSNRKPIYNRLVKLTNQRKWKVIHADKFSAVFVRNK